MPSASSLFLLFLYFRKVTTGNIVGLPSKFTAIFYSMEGTRGPKGDLGAPQASEVGGGHGPLGPAGGARLCPLGTASAPSDAYKILKP